MPTKVRGGGLARRLTQDEILQNIAEEHTGFDVTNAFHVFKSNKPCSQRTQVAALVAKASSMPRSSAQRYRRNKKRQKQEDALKEITEAPDSLKISSSILHKFCLVFTNDPTDGPLELSKCTPNVPHPVSLSSWKVIGESGDQGSIFRPDKQKLPVFLKPPRQILTSDNVTQNLLDVLEKLETTCNHQSRGKSRYVGCDEHKTNYITLGVHANRGRKGLVDSKFSKLKAKEKRVILQFIKQLETQLEKWIDWSYSFAFENSARNGEFKLWSHKGKVHISSPLLRSDETFSFKPIQTTTLVCPFLSSCLWNQVTKTRMKFWLNLSSQNMDKLWRYDTSTSSFSILLSTIVSPRGQPNMKSFV